MLDLQEKVPFTDWIESIFKLPLLDYPGDIFPSWGNSSNEYMRNHHDKEMLLVMERTLYSSSLTCIESALHGLNHWVGNYRERIHQIIDKFLSNRGELPPEIHEQAEWAKKGTMP